MFKQLEDFLDSCDADRAGDDAPLMITPTAPPVIHTTRVPTPRPPAPTLADYGRWLRELQLADPLRWGRIMSSWRAAQVFADHYDLNFADLRAEMAKMPGNLWSLFDSPEGWTVLAEQLSITLGGAACAAVLIPTKH